MNLWPSREHTIVTGWSKPELLQRIARHTQEVDSEFITEQPLFNGKISGNGFRISSVIKTPQNALPLIVGELEETSRGTILFLRMRLFPAAILYLKVFSLLAAIIGIIFIVLARLALPGITAFALGIFNYLIITVNFQKHAKRSVSELEKLLEEPAS